MPPLNIVIPEFANRVTISHDGFEFIVTLRDKTHTEIGRSTAEHEADSG